MCLRTIGQVGVAMKTRYLHVGFPKTGSTKLQDSFYSQHPELMHLGGPFLSNGLRDAVQLDLLMKNKFQYEQSNTDQVFSSYFQDAEEDESIKAVGLC